MENASKALLIAAAVLIVILLIAFGMKILGSSDNTAEQAEKVGQSITSESVIATEKTLEALKGVDTAAGASTTPGTTVTPTTPTYSETVTFKIQTWNYSTFIAEKEFTVIKGTTWRKFGEDNNAIEETLGSINPKKIGMGGEYLATVKGDFFIKNSIDLNDIIKETTYYTAVVVE